MKKIYIILFLLIVFSFAGFSQSYFIEGTQKKLDQNLQFDGEPVFIPVQCVITNVVGDFSSFSLRIDNATKYQFYYETDEFVPPFSQVIIEPGMYVLYPDLPPNVDSIKIQVELMPVDIDDDIND